MPGGRGTGGLTPGEPDEVTFRDRRGGTSSDRGGVAISDPRTDRYDECGDCCGVLRGECCGVPCGVG